jgi:hypothetical protein
MPDARCPTCGEWSPRQDWTDASAQAFPFTIVCPRCDRGSDVADIDYRLGASTPTGRTPRVTASTRGPVLVQAGARSPKGGST